MSKTRHYPGLALLADCEHLGSFLDALNARYGDRPALSILRGDRMVTHRYCDVHARAGQMAAHLETLGIAPGDRVAILGDNSPEWLMASFAIARRGAVAVPLDAQLTQGEITHLLDHSEARAIFAAERWVKALEAAGRHHVLTLAPATFESLDLPPAPPVKRSGDDLAAILYTSGTTGSPKGVMLTHRNLLSNVWGCSEVLYIEPQDVLMSLLPLHHAYAYTTTLIALGAGLPVVLPHSLKPDSVVAALQAGRVTALPAVPLLVDHLARGIRERIDAQPPLPRTFARLLLGLARFVRPRVGARAARAIARPITKRLGCLRGLVVGGAALTPDSATFFDSLGIVVMHGYGLTETAPVVALTERPWRPGAGVGRPLQGVEVRIDAPDAEGVGEVLVRGPNVMAGYYRNAAATEAAFADGWLRTGDLGRLDEAGRLQLSGRSKDVIVLSSGKNVYPEELELHYGQSELIAELCVVTGHAEDGSEQPLGVIVPSPKVHARLDVATDDAMRRLIGGELSRLSTGLADYKRLKRFVLQSEALPQTTSRKVRRHVVQAEAQALSASAGS